MKAHIEVIEGKLFAGAIADEIAACISEAIDERGSCTVALAGGSTPAVVYRSLARPPRVDSIDWSKVTFFWGDERWVPKDDNQSNFRMVQETLLSHIPAPGPKVHAVDTSLDSPQAASSSYTKTIQSTLGTDPAFDLVLLGIGEDGHTASIFPGSPVLNSEQQICCAVIHPEEGKPRITLAPTVLLKARKLLFMVKGEAKASIVPRILEGDEPASALPARLVFARESGVHFFLDSEASTKLSKR